MKSGVVLSPGRRLTQEEQKLIWKKPLSHIESEAERRICAEIKRNWHHPEMKITNILLEGDAGSGKTQLAKALSAQMGLPYTKVTCFADMDKSDILGSILPVLQEENQSANKIRYAFYPSEIVRAYENGWLLEIQEPTVIRDAAVLMALNSALEPDGSINLPTRIVHRHPDFIAVITTNRGYNGCRPLNEALRDRVHHTEKMDLPPKEVMMARAVAKTGYPNEAVLSLLASIIMELDKAAKANAIKGVAGMRSYLFWIDAIASGVSFRSAMYHKVLYKITTDPDEIAILEQVLHSKNLFSQLDALAQPHVYLQEGENVDLWELHSQPNGEPFLGSEKETPKASNAIRLCAADDQDSLVDQSTESNNRSGKISGKDGGGTPFYHEAETTPPTQQQKQDFRKKLNQQARESVKGQRTSADQADCSPPRGKGRRPRCLSKIHIGACTGNSRVDA